MRTELSLLTAAAALSALAGQAAAVTNDVPFALLRSYGTYEDNRDFTERVFAAQERHPGLIEEIWFSGGGDEFGDPAAYGRGAAERNLGAKGRCRELGIRFSYQQGVTLNHGPDGVRRANIPEDAWVVDRNGKVQYGLFCCTSSFVKDFCREKAKAVMAALKPDTYWPDDDLRLNKLPNAPSLCFCPRCVKLFGEKVGRTFDREGLLLALTNRVGSAEIRRQWCAFNGEMLGAYAKVYREAADAVSPATRICQQSPYVVSAVNGDAYRHILAAYDGNGVGTGVRPGGGYYGDENPFALLGKGMCVAKDAARVSRLGCVREICYEAENWPHIGALKSPGGMMTENAYAIALGCNSLALYWGADLNGESAASYDFFFDTFAAWKPFLVSMRDAFRGTLPGGVASCFGEGRFASDSWLTTMDVWHAAVLARNALPVADQEAYPDCYTLNGTAVSTLAKEDLAKVFAKAVLVDVTTFGKLAERFPDLGFVRKVRVTEPPREKALATDLRAAGFEKFKTLGKCETVLGFIYPQAPDVVRMSELTADPKACGTCLIPTEFGGTVVLVQDMAFAAPGWAGPQHVWAGCRRHAILDALDVAVPGGLPVRLRTDGYACVVVARKTPDGRTAGAFVMNTGTGETPPLELAIRRGVGNRWQLLRPKADAVAVGSSVGGETVVRLPPLPPFGVAAIVPAPAATAAVVKIGTASSMEQVRPQSGRAVEDAAEVSLRLARNEKESVQLLVRPENADLSGVTVEASDLRRDGSSAWKFWNSATLSAQSVDCEVVGYVYCRFPEKSRYSRDTACNEKTETAPFYKRTHCRCKDGWYPDLIAAVPEGIEIKRGDVQSFWIRVRCPSDQPAGTYRGTLTVRSGTFARELPFVVRVNDFEVPRASPLPLAITYGPMSHCEASTAESQAEAKRCAADPEGPVQLAKANAAAWGDFLADYYITMDSLYTRTNLNWAVLTKLRDEGRLGRFNLGYWSSFKTNQTEASWRAETLPRLRRNYDEAKRLGILDHAYIYGCDEAPTNLFDNIRTCVQILKREFPGVPISTTAYDDKFGVGTALDVFDWFTPLTPKFDVARAMAARAEGRQVWWYICCGPGNPWANAFTMCQPLDMRMLMGAQTTRMRPDGFLYYEISIWNAPRPVSKWPYTDWEPRSFMTLNGDGCWTGVGPGGRPLPTLRLENFRDGLEDYAYALKLEEKLMRHPESPLADEARRLLSVPRSVMDKMDNFTDDPALILGWRNAMADLIERPW